MGGDRSFTFLYWKFDLDNSIPHTDNSLAHVGAQLRVVWYKYIFRWIPNVRAHGHKMPLW